MADRAPSSSCRTFESQAAMFRALMEAALPVNVRCPIWINIPGPAARIKERVVTAAVLKISPDLRFALRNGFALFSKSTWMGIQTSTLPRSGLTNGKLRQVWKDCSFLDCPNDTSHVSGCGYRRKLTGSSYALLFSFTFGP